MKRLIKAEVYYHATNEQNFTINNSFNNKQQEMGSGLYITNLEDIFTWDNLLLHRDYIVELNGNLNIIKEENMPNVHKMANDLIKNNYTLKDVKKEEQLINGETFNRNKHDIAIKRLWSKMNNYDAIEPYFDEGYQLLVLNTKHLTKQNYIILEKIFLVMLLNYIIMET